MPESPEEVIARECGNRPLLDPMAVLIESFDFLAQGFEELMRQPAFGKRGLCALGAALVTPLLVVLAVEGISAFILGPVAVGVFVMAAYALIPRELLHEPIDASVFMPFCRCPRCGLEDWHALTTSIAFPAPSEFARECNCGHQWGQRVLVTQALNQARQRKADQ